MSLSSAPPFLTLFFVNPAHKSTLCGSTVIISMIRIRYLQLYEDFPWENVTSSLWSVGELTSAITCACLPTLRPFLVTYFPRLASAIGGSRAHPTGAMSAGVAVDGTGRIQTVDPETGVYYVGRGQHSRARSGAKKGAAVTVECSDGTGSEVELSPQQTKVNPFEAHVIHKSESLHCCTIYESAHRTRTSHLYYTPSSRIKYSSKLKLFCPTPNPGCETCCDLSRSIQVRRAMNPGNNALHDTHTFIFH